MGYYSECRFRFSGPKEGEANQIAFAKKLLAKYEPLVNRLAIERKLEASSKYEENLCWWYSSFIDTLKQMIGMELPENNNGQSFTVHNEYVQWDFSGKFYEDGQAAINHLFRLIENHKGQFSFCRIGENDGDVECHNSASCQFEVEYQTTTSFVD